MMKKRGNILTENLVFIILNLIFLSILIGFVAIQGNGHAVSEENYAKNIALLIDSSQPYTEITLDLEKVSKKIDKDFPFSQVVHISDNTVIVKFSDESAGSYSFFNDVRASANPSSSTSYVLRIEEKNE